MARTKRLAILAVTFLVLGGCGGSGTTPITSAATSQQPSVGAGPTVTQSAVSSAAALASLASQYTDLSNKGNAAVAQCNKDKTAAVGSLTKSKAAAQECLTAYSQYVADFVAVDWGPAQPQADKVIDAINGIVTLVRQMANATSAASFKVYYDQLPAATASLLTAANALRAALGMPPANT